ncbi:A disintegrin and metalloproteinase with thrombospondin motifs 3 [Elysia marginata]|uniref:A disintegrin and metalloproteinase with thrombospondin motifs 3 n=1 Tax=Elysia marginata TaxID=1093978 RepID=A0AAV4EHS2_9GAST|nr:A disintegrin and metalloproteinase with thrombospondin motifs 3 [Elysia marginata]
MLSKLRHAVGENLISFSSESAADIFLNFTLICITFAFVVLLQLRKKGKCQTEPGLDCMMGALYPNKLVQNTSVLFRYSVPKDDFTFEKNRFIWKFKSWSQCSVTCGIGEQTIVHRCIDKDRREEVDSSNCKFLKPPRKDKVRCTREQCGLTSYNYAMSREFEECDADCGQYGVQKQLYYCERADVKTGEYTPVGMKSCAHIPPPNIVRKCQAPPCNSSVHFRWSVSNTWSDCPCGENNTQTRNATCEKVTSNTTQAGNVETVAETEATECENLPEMPPTSRPCSGPPCEPIFRWTATDKFGACDAACGEAGNHTRLVVCKKVNSQSQNPQMEFSDFRWAATDKFGACNAACGEAGNHTRIVVCKKVNSQSQNPQMEFSEHVADKFCSKHRKPEPEIKQCVGDPCPEPEIHFQWNITGTWSDCPCGGNSSQSRNVTCQKVTTQQGSKGNVQTIEDTALEDCKNLPETKRFCRSPPCKPTFQWSRAGSYGPCNASCGQTGYQAARLVCEEIVIRDLSGGLKEVTSQADVQFCSKLDKPNVEMKACAGAPCPKPAVHFQWLVSETWSQCPCGKNKRQIRTITCQKLTTRPGVLDKAGSGHVQTTEKTDEKACAHLSDKPAASRKCDGPPCKPTYALSFNCGQIELRCSHTTN